MLPAFFCLCFVLFASLIPDARGQCRNLRFINDPVNGQRLENHVIRTIDVINEDICQLKCYLEPNCVSYNFKKIADTDGKHRCDLNNATYEHDNEHSGDLAKNESYVYRGAENACAKKPCQNNATCQVGFTDRDYQCLCINGFTDHDCQQDVDECTKGTHSCDENATCQNIKGSYKCTCKDGFSGDGINCTDVDECKGTHSCDENATCQIIMESYKCTCKDGFSGDGINCTDVDECTKGTHSCDENATCQNIPGSYNCKSNDGFSGDGKNYTASSLPYQNIGCFTDNLTSPAIETLEGQDSILDGNYTTRNDSITKCWRAAKKRGFHIFAVQDGGRCASNASAANTFDKYGNSSDCESDGRGGPLANEVYYITGHVVVGCYKDNESHAIRKLEGEDSILVRPYKKRKNAIAKCAVAAIRAGYSMLAVQDSGQCFASATAPQTFDMYGNSTECGADGEGGAWTSQVYIIKDLGCQETLGLESGAISDGKISASSELRGFSASQGRLHHSKAWIPTMVDSHSWLQVDLSIVHRVTGVATQGIDYHFSNGDVDFYHYWVTKYKLRYWNDTEGFQYYKESGQNAIKNFAGNTDTDTVVYHDLHPPITARYIRFEPVDNGNVSMRVELYGCLQECQDALGMENGAITDAQITASSEYSEDDDYEHVSMAMYGRLHFQENGSITGAWVANTSDDNQWLQVDLGTQYAKVTGLATQGRNSTTYPQWVTKYKLQYGDNGEAFQFYREHRRTTGKEFTGNTDQDTVVYHKLIPLITTRYIRFVPVAWNGNISMRVELYGCKQGTRRDITFPKAISRLQV